MNYRFLLLFFLTGLSAGLRAQELQCGVVVSAPQLRVVDPKVFKTLETSIYEFMNNRTWTGDKFKLEEKIRCDINITITDELDVDRFRAQVAIQSSRPVYNSDYQTVVFNWVDKDWEFSYVEYQPLEFNENIVLNNLTSMLAYYAYIIIGLDYDSYALNGGTTYLQKAQKIVNNSQNAVEKGWKPYDGIRNRYWLTDNLNNPRFAAYREAFYKYHRLGLDVFHQDAISTVSVITQALTLLNGVNTSNPNSMAIQVFFNAKSDEIIGIYTDAPSKEQAQAIAMLNRMDAQNANDYRKILTGGR
jgi:hypothetical protein